MLVYHHGDPDGRCAAAVVLKARGKGRCIEMQYDRQPQEADYRDEDIYVVDFSFKPEVFREIMHKAKSIVWIDHHKTILQDDYAEFKVIPGIRDTRAAACKLTWEHLMGQVPIPWAVEYIADHDAWIYSHGDETREFLAGMELLDQRPYSADWPTLLDNDNRVGQVRADGKICLAFRTNMLNGYRKSFAYVAELEGHKCHVINFNRYGSYAHGEAFTQYPICISYVDKGGLYICSLYTNDKDLDVSLIAQKFGGGGHKNAAGFQVTTLPWKKL